MSRIVHIVHIIDTYPLMLLYNFVKVGVGSIQFGTFLISHLGCWLFQAKLSSVLRMYRDTLTADMKNAIKTAVADLLPILLSQPFGARFFTWRTSRGCWWYVKWDPSVHNLIFILLTKFQICPTQRLCKVNFLIFLPWISMLCWCTIGTRIYVYCFLLLYFFRWRLIACKQIKTHATWKLRSTSDCYFKNC